MHSDAAERFCEVVGPWILNQYSHSSTVANIVRKESLSSVKASEINRSRDAAPLQTLLSSKL
jgi:hypothetical protein